MIAILLVLNFAISILNAWSVGRGWAETKCVGGFARIMSWAGGIMAACGFTWCYLVIIGGVAFLTGYLPEKYLQGFFALGYLAIILPIIGSGLAITIDSWAHFWRRRTFGSGAVAGWNTFAQIYNTVSAFEGVPRAFSSVLGMFRSKDKSDTNLALLAVMLALLAVLGGVLTAVWIIRTTAKHHAFNVTLDRLGKMAG